MESRDLSLSGLVPAEEGVGEDLLERQTLVWIFGSHASDEIESITVDRNSVFSTVRLRIRMKAAIIPV